MRGNEQSSDLCIDLHIVCRQDVGGCVLLVSRIEIFGGG